MLLQQERTQEPSQELLRRHDMTNSSRLRDKNEVIWLTNLIIVYTDSV